MKLTENNCLTKARDVTCTECLQGSLALLALSNQLWLLARSAGASANLLPGNGGWTSNFNRQPAAWQRWVNSRRWTVWSLPGKSGWPITRVISMMDRDCTYGRVLFKPGIYRKSYVEAWRKNLLRSWNRHPPLQSWNMFVWASGNTCPVHSVVHILCSIAIF